MFDLEAEFKKRQAKLIKKLDEVYVRHGVRSWFDEIDKKAYLQALDEGGIKKLEIAIAKELTENGLKFYGEAKYKEAVDSFRRALNFRILYFGEGSVECQDSKYEYALSLIKLKVEEESKDVHKLHSSLNAIADEFIELNTHKPSLSRVLFLKALGEAYLQIGAFVAASENLRNAIMMFHLSRISGGPITRADVAEMSFQAAVSIQRSGGNILEALKHSRYAKYEAETVLFDVNASKSDRERLDGFLQRVETLIGELEG